MTITANEGATVLGFPGAPLSGMPANTNPETGPSLSHDGMAYLDPRGPYTYIPGQNFGKKIYGVLQSHYCAIDQVVATATVNNIAAAQTATAGTALTLRSANTTGITASVSIVRADTGATVTGLLAVDSAMSGVLFGTAGTINIWNPNVSIARCITVTSSADDATGTYTIAGFDLYGYPLTQALTGGSTATVTSTKAFKYIASVTPSGTVNSTGVTVGTADTVGLPLRADRQAETLIYYGTTPTLMSGTTTGSEQVVSLPVTLSQVSTTSNFFVAAPFNGKVVGGGFTVGAQAALTTGLATIVLQANSTSVTGGVLTLSAAALATSGVNATATAVTAANSFTAGQLIGFSAATVSTAFATGAGYFYITLLNTDQGGGTFTAAITATATTTTGDTRGTYALPTASDGVKRLVVYQVIPPNHIGTATSVFGVTQS